MIFCKQPIFEARKDGYRVCRIPGINVTKSGVVIASAECRKGGGGDWDPIDIRIRRSMDNGDTWLEPQPILNHEDYAPERPISNFVTLCDRDSGLVHGLFCQNYEKVFHRVSRDDGATWGEARDITEAAMPLREKYPWKVIATGPGHGLVHSSGRYIIPLWLSDGSGTDFGAKKLSHRPSVISSLYSDDRGETWKCGEIIARHEEEGLRNPSETVAVELNDGRVLFNIRSESKKHRRAYSISPDGFSNWSPYKYDESLLEPICMASIVRYGDKVLFANPDLLAMTEKNFTYRNGPPWAGKMHDRRNLTVRLSRDDGATWPVSKVIEPGWAGYSDMAVTNDGFLLCLYEDQIIEGMTDDRYITCAKFDLDWMVM